MLNTHVWDSRTFKNLSIVCAKFCKFSKLAFFDFTVASYPRKMQPSGNTTQEDKIHGGDSPNKSKLHFCKHKL